MASAPFDYAAPRDLGAAIKLLQDRPGAKILAGGHALLPALKLREASVPCLVDLRNLPELRGIHHADGHEGLQIGAMTVLADIAADGDLREHYPALLEALEATGDPQVRNRATLGGSLAMNAAGHPSDLAAVLLAYEATASVADADGSHSLSVDQLVADPAGILGQAGVVVRVQLPRAGASHGSAYEKLRDPASLYPVCGVAVRLDRAADGTLARCRVAVTGATPRPTRLTALEAQLEGKAPGATLLSMAFQQVADTLSYVTDFAASSEYRRHLVGVLGDRALARASLRAGFHTPVANPAASPVRA